MISVIVPVYNVGPYIRRCLDSILAQTERDIEVILIDDGSTDGCGEICDGYAHADDRVRVIHNENRGLAATRNTGLELANGEYISFIDSDDWIEPETFSELLKAASATGADIVAGGRCMEYAGKTVTPKKQDDPFLVFRGDELLAPYAKGIFCDVVWNKIYRRECFSGIRFPEGFAYEDIATTWVLMKKLAENGGTIASLSQVFFHFRMRKSSLSHTLSLRNIEDAWNAYIAKYEALNMYPEDLLPGCIAVIGKMWRSYSTLSREEKKKAGSVVREMQAFSKNHIRQVMRSRIRPRYKLFCLVSQSASPVIMRLCHMAADLLSKLRPARSELFD